MFETEKDFYKWILDLLKTSTNYNEFHKKVLRNNYVTCDILKYVPVGMKPLYFWSFAIYIEQYETPCVYSLVISDKNDINKNNKAIEDLEFIINNYDD